MAKIIRTEIRQRSAFGKIVKWSFIIFNIVMLVSMLSYCSTIGGAMESAAGDAEKAGTAIGATLGSGLLMGIWGFGALILGIFTLLTRGKKTIVEEAQE